MKHKRKRTNRTLQIIKKIAELEDSKYNVALEAYHKAKGDIADTRILLKLHKLRNK